MQSFYIRISCVPQTTEKCNSILHTYSERLRCIELIYSLQFYLQSVQRLKIRSFNRVTRVHFIHIIYFILAKRYLINDVLELGQTIGHLNELIGFLNHRKRSVHEIQRDEKLTLKCSSDKRTKSMEK